MVEIRIFKKDKILEFWLDNQLIKTFPIGIGKEEYGHKLFEGDMKTPEGEYQVCVKNPKSKFYLSLGLNYPNLIDAKNALEEGRINKEDHDNICDAHRNDKGPPWNTAIGGQIYIHGDLENKSWSEGCIRMYNGDIEFLFQKVSVGTKVIITP